MPFWGVGGARGSTQIRQTAQGRSPQGPLTGPAVTPYLQDNKRSGMHSRGVFAAATRKRLSTHDLLSLASVRQVLVPLNVVEMLLCCS